MRGCPLSTNLEPSFNSDLYCKWTTDYYINDPDKQEVSNTQEVERNFCKISFSFPLFKILTIVWLMVFICSLIDHQINIIRCMTSTQSTKQYYYSIITVLHDCDFRLWIH